MVVNATINATQTVVYSFVDTTFSRFMELVTAPYHHSELLWITIPLIIVLVFMDIYFGRYRKEELGWNTAVGNSLALMFVSMDLFRQLFNRLQDPSLLNIIMSDIKGVLVVVVLALGSIWLFIADFFHVLPKKLAFLISSSLPTTIFAYTAIVLIYTDMSFDRFTLIALVFLFILLLVLLKTIQFFVPVYLKED